MRTCLVTGNPCGTDTWAVGCPCPCVECSAYLLERRPSKRGPHGERLGPGEFWIAAIDKVILVEELRFVRPDKPLTDGWKPHPIQLATYRDRVAFALEDVVLWASATSQRRDRAEPLPRPTTS